MRLTKGPTPLPEDSPLPCMSLIQTYPLHPKLPGVVQFPLFQGVAHAHLIHETQSLPWNSSLLTNSSLLPSLLLHLFTLFSVLLPKPPQAISRMKSLEKPLRLLLSGNLSPSLPLSPLTTSQGSFLLKAAPTPKFPWSFQSCVT